MSYKEEMPRLVEEKKRANQENNGERVSFAPIDESYPRYLSDKQVARHFGVSKPTIWRWARLGINDFPKPVKLSENCTRWTLGQIAAHDKKLSAQ